MATTWTDNADAERALRQRLATLQSVAVTVGVHGVDGPRSDSKADNVTIASTHEFGSPDRGIPERSFIRATIAGQLPTIASTMSAMAAEVVDGLVAPRAAVKVIGETVVGMIKQRLADGVGPPLSAATLRRRLQRTAKGRRKLATLPAGASPSHDGIKPLVDTGQLRNSITAKVGPRV